MLAETCEFMAVHVEKNPNMHGPGKMHHDATTACYQGCREPSHDGASHRRELNFWEARRKLYAEAAG